MKKKSILIATLFILYCCSGISKNAFAQTDFAVTKTNKLTTANAKVFYTKSNRKHSQFALDLSSKKDETKNFIVKVSKSKIIVLDNNNHIVHEYSVSKSWLDKSGPQTVYDLIDANKTECSLTDYVDIQHHHYFSFRYKKILETYSNE